MLRASAALLAMASLPPAPPLGPPPPPQPNCKTCRWPQHSWATIPSSVHTSRINTNANGEFTEDDIAVLSHFPLVTIEKWQGQGATDDHGQPAFIWEEDAWANAARQLKEARPNVSVVVWMDTMLVYTGWMFPSPKDPKNPPINHTLNPDAQKACATGHFRPAEFIERYPQLLVHNSSGQVAVSGYGQCHVYDHQQARVRQYWRDNCLKMANTGVIDGCGADFSAGGPNSMARNTVQNTMQFLSLNESTAVAWRAGKRQMMIDTTAALGNGLLIGKDAAELGDHVNAVLHEGCDASNGTIKLLQNITASARALNRRLLYQCHTKEGLSNNTLAAFLIGAGPDHYIASGGWSQFGKMDGYWTPVLGLPLGEPHGDGVYDPATQMWTRTFGPGTRVSFNATNHTGTIAWASAALAVAGRA